MKTKKHNLMATAFGTAFITLALGGITHAAVDGSTGVNMTNVGKITNAPPTTNATSVTSSGTSWEFTSSLQGFVVPASQFTGRTTAGGTVNYEDLLPIKATKLSVMVGAAGAAPTGIGTIIDGAGIETNGLDLIDTATSTAVPLTVTNGALKVNGTTVGGALGNISLTSESSPAGTTPGQTAYNTSTAGAVGPGLIIWDGSTWQEINATTIPNTSVTMDMLSIPSGTLTTLGGSAANISISAFTMSRTETTATQYTTVRTWALNHGYTGMVAGGWNESQPVGALCQFDAMKWCNALSERQGFTPAYYADVNSNSTYDAGTDTLLRTGAPTAVVTNAAATGFKLPTQAQWEWAARGGNMTADIYPWGTTTIDSTYARYAQPSPNPSAVSSFPNGRNPYGLDDMAGNVWEWTSDLASGSTTNGILCGGTSNSTASSVTVSSNAASNISANPASANLGFRVIK
jgi:formylglycine-generating enzyme required for sulfatase activity